MVADAEDSPTVSLRGLPSGLSYGLGEVSGTVAPDTTAKDYPITISANDGVNAAVSATFTINVLPTISTSQTCSDEWFIDEIVELSEEGESLISPRILKLYLDKIQEVERTSKILLCKAEVKLSKGGDVFLTYYHEIDRDGDELVGYSVGDPVPPPGSTLDDAFPKGEVMTGSDGTQIRVVSIARDAWPLISAKNQFNNPPKEGNRFFMVRLEITNPPDALQSVTLSTYDFELIGDNRVVYTQFDEGCGLIPDELDSEIFSGGSIEGNVCFELPTDEGGLILIHKPWLDFDEENRRFLWITD